MVVRKQIVYNVLLTVIICNSVLTTALATNNRIGQARRPWTFRTERAASLPRTFESNDAREHPLEQRQNPIVKRYVVKSVAGVTLTFLLIKNRCVFKHSIDLYRSSLSNNPLQTKVLTGATLSLLGDGAAQTREVGESARTYDMRRGLSFVAFDAIYRMFQHVAIPIIVKLGQGNVLSCVLPGVGVGFLRAMERTLIYQFVLIPCIYYPGKCFRCLSWGGVREGGIGILTIYLWFCTSLLHLYGVASRIKHTRDRCTSKTNILPVLDQKCQFLDSNAAYHVWASRRDVAGAFCMPHGSTLEFYFERHSRQSKSGGSKLNTFFRLVTVFHRIVA